MTEYCFPVSTMSDASITDLPFDTSSHYWEIENKDVVVVPSLSFDCEELASVHGISHYEERMLYVLFGLASPRTRITIITSRPLDPTIIEYYLSVLPEITYDKVKSRLLMLSVCDSTPSVSLSQKILNRPRVLHRMKQMVHPESSVLNVLRGTELEEEIATILNIPIYSAKPEHQIWGSKAGSRALFKQCKIPVCDGTFETCKDVEQFITWNMMIGQSDKPKIPKYYVASDNIEHSDLRQLLPIDIIEMMKAAPDINWCAQRQTGVVFHMLGCLSHYGKIGLTAIHNSPDAAQKLFDDAVAMLMAESKKNPLNP